MGNLPVNLNGLVPQALNLDLVAEIEPNQSPLEVFPPEFCRVTPRQAEDDSVMIEPLSITETRGSTLVQDDATDGATLI